MHDLKTEFGLLLIAFFYVQHNNRRILFRQITVAQLFTYVGSRRK